MIPNKRVSCPIKAQRKALLLPPTRMSVWNHVQMMRFYSKSGNLCEVPQLFSYLLFLSHKPEVCHGCELLPVIGVGGSEIGIMSVTFFIFDHLLYKLPNMSLSFFILYCPPYKLPSMSLSFFILDCTLYKLSNMSLSFFILDGTLYKLSNMSFSFFILDCPLYKLPNMS